MKSVMSGLMLLALCSGSGIASAADVEESVILNSSVSSVWKLVGNFNGINQWHPAVRESEQDGDVRLLTLRDGGHIREVQLAHDDEHHLYRYRMDQSPLPVAGYKAEIRLETVANNKTRMIWKSHFEAVGVPEAEAEQTIRTVYRTGMDNLARRFNH